MLTKRQKRVVNAFIDCVEKGEYSFDYATTLIEDENKYGYLTEEAKEVFYARFESTPNDEEPETEIVEDAEDTGESEV